MIPTEQARWFDQEVKPHEPILRGYLMKRFPSLPDHDDIVQESYIRLLRANGAGLKCAKAYLFTIARNVAIDMLRRRKNVALEPISELVELPVLEEASGVAEFLDRNQREDALVEAIASLPNRCREVVKLRHVDGLAYKEIAVRLGISPSTVRIHLIKGMRDCADFFEKLGLLEDPAENSSSP